MKLRISTTYHETFEGASSNEGILLIIQVDRLEFDLMDPPGEEKADIQWNLRFSGAMRKNQGLSSRLVLIGN